MFSPLLTLKSCGEEACQISHLKSTSVEAQSKTTHTSVCNNMLEIAESYWFRHEYINIDNFVITDCIAKQGVSELDSKPDSKDKVFTVG